MSKLLITNIDRLVQVRDQNIDRLQGKQMNDLPCIESAWLSISQGVIEDFGARDYDANRFSDYQKIDAQGGHVFPSWVDSHSHVVYAGTREGEFVDRINGLSYAEIASRGGGILNSAKKLSTASEDELYEQAKNRLDELMRLGTGAIEIKSGYGLTLESELKMLRVIKKLRATHPITIKSTFLGAHAVPVEFKDNQKGYIQHVIEDILPKVVDEKLADYIDIFCEDGYFDTEDLRAILEAGNRHGLIGKPHVNQFKAIGGVPLSVTLGARSVDHLEVMNEEDFAALENAETMPVALPGCSLFLSIPYTPGRSIIDRGMGLALASDYNPGSCPSGNMNLVVALACIKMRLTPEEAINAATINGAYAMHLENELGTITKGKKANIFITKKMSSYSFIPYSYGESQIKDVILNGELIKR